MEDIIELAVSGMLIDGAHHKQWYLEEIAKLAAGGTMVNHEATDANGVSYTYQRRSRGALELRLAAERVYFDDSAIERETDGDYWEIESGIAP